MSEALPLHYEVTIEAFRRLLEQSPEGAQAMAVDVFRELQHSRHSFARLQAHSQELAEINLKLMAHLNGAIVRPWALMSWVPSIQDWRLVERFEDEDAAQEQARFFARFFKGRIQYAVIYQPQEAA